MRWKKYKQQKGILQLVSMSNKLKTEGKITPEFEVMLNNLTLEEIIALKLELSAKIIKNTFIGIPIWYSLGHVARDAVLKYSFAISQTKSEAAYILGLAPLPFKKALYRYRTHEYFKNLTIKYKPENGLFQKLEQNILNKDIYNKR